MSANDQAVIDWPPNDLRENSHPAFFPNDGLKTLLGSGGVAGTFGRITLCPVPTPSFGGDHVSRGANKGIRFFRRDLRNINA